MSVRIMDDKNIDYWANQKPTDKKQVVFGNYTLALGLEKNLDKTHYQPATSVSWFYQGFEVEPAAKYEKVFLCCRLT